MDIFGGHGGLEEEEVLVEEGKGGQAPEKEGVGDQG